MRQEFSRQLVHMSGIFFIILAQFIDKQLAATYFALIAITFLIYSEHMRREYRKIRGVAGLLGRAMRDAASYLERRDAPRPFFGAFWFYAGLAATFFLFPLDIASAACASLAVGDSLSTLAGKRFGRHRIIGKKTVEGSMVLLISAFAVSNLFIGFFAALTCAVFATLAELVPEARAVKTTGLRLVLDDNLLIPLVSASAVYIQAIIL